MVTTTKRAGFAAGAAIRPRRQRTRRHEADGARRPLLSPRAIGAPTPEDPIHPSPLDFAPERDLLPSQKKAIFDVITQVGLDPRAFMWENQEDDWTGWDDPFVPAIVHRSTRFSCAISNHPRPKGGGDLVGFQVSCTPGDQRRFETIDGLQNFDQVLAQVRAWIDRIRREDIPDPWQETENSRAVVAQVIEREPDNAQLGPEDRARIAEVLDRLKALAGDQNLTAAQLDRVDNAVAYLKDAASRLGPKDWFFLAVMTLQWLVPAPEFGKAVIEALAWVVHLPVPLPHLPPPI